MRSAACSSGSTPPGSGASSADPATSEGAALIDRLAARADVLIETRPGGVRTHPRLVVASITPFGRTGPYRDWRSSDLVAQAMGGMLAVSGHPDGPPLHSLGLQAYHQAGVFAATGVLAALLARERTGRGQHVDVSLQAAVAASLEHVPGLFHQTGKIPKRQGTLHWTRFFRVGRCRDGWVMHCTLGDWTSLIEWVKSDGLGADIDEPEMQDPMHRQRAADRIFAVLDAWAERYTVAELYQGAQLRRIPYAAVRAPEALLSDAHLADTRLLRPDRASRPGTDRAVSRCGVPHRGRALARRPAAAPRRAPQRSAARLVRHLMRHLRPRDFARGASRCYATSRSLCRPIVANIARPSCSPPSSAISCAAA